jgi:predicted amidohydrolase
MMRLAMAQLLVEPGNGPGNLQRAVRAVERAAREGADAVLLPEALDWGWTHPSAVQGAGAVPGGESYEALRDAAYRQRVMVCAGLVERSGERLYNAAVLISAEGELLLHHRKLNELAFAQRLYARGDRLGVAETPHGRVGVMICADAFADGLVISRALGQMGAGIILSPCAWAVPPEHDQVREPYGKLWRDSYGPPAKEFGMWIAGCSNVGPVTAGEWVDWHCIGCSLVVGPDGEPVAQGGYGREAEEFFVVEVG